MRHEQVIENLSGYVEGTLEAGMQASVENHIRGCADCYREAATLREVVDMLSSTPLDVEPPPMFHDDAMRRVRLSQRAAQKTPRGVLRRIGWGWTTAGFATATAALLAVVWAVGPLHEGAPAGFIPGSGVQAPQAVTGLMVSAPALSAGQDAMVVVSLPSPFAGHLAAQTTQGLALPSAGRLDASGARMVWEGAVVGSSRAPVTITVRPTTAGQVETLSLRLVSGEDGREQARTDVFLPVQASGEGVRTLRSTGTARDVAASIAATFGVDVAVDGAALDAGGSVSVQASTAAEALQSFATQRGLRLTESGGAYNLTK